MFCLVFIRKSAAREKPSGRFAYLRRWEGGFEKMLADMRIRIQ